MKLYRMFAAAALATALLATACQKYDDTEIYDRVIVLEGKVSTLEDAISSLKNAVDNKYAVESVEATENGWTIKFTNGKSIDIVNGDSFLSSITESDEFVTITLNDEAQTTFNLAKVVKIVIADEESTYVLIDDENNEVELKVPAIENIASVAGTIYAAGGNTTDVVTKANASGWTVKIAKDFSKATLIPEDVAKGSRALFVVTLTKTDGTTYTSSKPIIYFMTDDTAFEQFNADYESLQEQWTMAYNSTFGNEENEEYIPFLEEELLPIINGASQMIAEKMTWATESYENGTLAAELDEILASFEDIQKVITQFLNRFNDDLALLKANNAAFEQFNADYQSLQNQWTMAYNTTFGNEENEAYIPFLEDELLPILNGASQMIEEKMTWATESYENGTLAEELDEILGSFEEIQLVITQFLNRWDDDLAALKSNLSAFEELSQAIEGLNIQLTQSMNATIYSEEFNEWVTDEETIAELTALFSGIGQQIETLMTWATESFEARTLDTDMDEIYAQFEPIQITMTQAMNRCKDTLSEIQNNAAYEAFDAELRSYQQQWTMIYNKVSENEAALAALATVYNTMNSIQNKVEKLYEDGELFDQFEAIMGELSAIQAELTKINNQYGE